MLGDHIISWESSKGKDCFSHFSLQEGRIVPGFEPWLMKARLCSNYSKGRQRPMMTKHARKKKFISREIQGRFLLTVIPYLLIYTAVLLLVFLAPSAMALVSDVSLEEQERAAQAFLMLHKSLWPAIFFSLAFIALHSILLSHKIAGPIYRFETRVQELAQGDVFREVQLREGDYFPGLMKTINLMTTTLKEELKLLKEESRTGLEHCSRLLHELQQGSVSPERLKNQMGGLAGIQ